MYIIINNGRDDWKRRLTKPDSRFTLYCNPVRSFSSQKYRDFFVAKKFYQIISW